MLESLILAQRKYKKRKNDKYINKYIREKYRNKLFDLNNYKLIRWLVKLASIEYYCLTFDWGRGIWKQIDENREVLGAYTNNIEKSYCLEAWISDTDLFLLGLLNILNFKFEHHNNFPRKMKNLNNFVEENEIKAEKTKVLVKKLIDKFSNNYFSIKDLKDNKFRELINVVIRHDNALKDKNELIEIIKMISLLKNNFKKLPIHARQKQ